VVAAERQGVMAVSVLSCDRVLAELDGRPVGDLEATSRAALARAPLAAKWASRFAGVARSTTVTPKRFRAQSAPTIVHSAVVGIAQACVPDPDAMLRDLLVHAIDACGTWGVRDPGGRARVRRGRCRGRAGRTPGRRGLRRPRWPIRARPGRFTPEVS